MSLQISSSRHLSFDSSINAVFDIFCVTGHRSHIDGSNEQAVYKGRLPTQTQITLTYGTL